LREREVIEPWSPCARILDRWRGEQKGRSAEECVKHVVVYVASGFSRIGPAANTLLLKADTTYESRQALKPPR